MALSRDAHVESTGSRKAPYFKIMKYYVKLLDNKQLEFTNCKKMESEIIKYRGQIIRIDKVDKEGNVYDVTHEYKINKFKQFEYYWRRTKWFIEQGEYPEWNLRGTTLDIAYYKDELKKKKEEMQRLYSDTKKRGLGYEIMKESIECMEEAIDRMITVRLVK